jgi:hypothetical protein
MIPPKLEILRELESCKSCREASYNSGLSTIDAKKQNNQLQLLMASNMKDLFKRLTLKEPKLVQLDKVLYKWFTAMCSTGKPITGPITEKAKSL